MWLEDRKNRRTIPHRFNAAGYVPVRNDARDTGLWVVGGVRQVVYAKKSLAVRDRLKAVGALQRAVAKKEAEAEGGAAARNSKPPPPRRASSGSEDVGVDVGSEGSEGSGLLLLFFFSPHSLLPHKSVCEGEGDGWKKPCSRGPLPSLPPLPGGDTGWGLAMTAGARANGVSPYSQIWRWPCSGAGPAPHPAISPKNSHPSHRDGG